MENFTAVKQKEEVFQDTDAYRRVGKSYYLPHYENMTFTVD